MSQCNFVSAQNSRVGGSVFHFPSKCLHSVSFLQNYLQPKEHWQTRRLNFFICTFLFLCVIIIGHISSDLDDLSSIRRRLEGNWDPDQLWKTEWQVNCLVTQWCKRPASSEAPVSTMDHWHPNCVDLFSERCPREGPMWGVVVVALRPSEWPEWGHPGMRTRRWMILLLHGEMNC